MRQLTSKSIIKNNNFVSKLPMRQLTSKSIIKNNNFVSKLPMRQLTRLLLVVLLL